MCFDKLLSRPLYPICGGPGSTIRHAVTGARSCVTEIVNDNYYGWSVAATTRRVAYGRRGKGWVALFSAVES